MKTLPSKALGILIVIMIGFTLNVTSQTVYKTNTGTKYHKADCRYLSSSKIESTVSKARAEGLTPCKVCKPTATATSTSELNNETPKSNPSVKTEVSKSAPEVKTETKTTTTQNATPTRCTAITKAGTQCKRTTTDPSGKCWQHK